VWKLFFNQENGVNEMTFCSNKKFICVLFSFVICAHSISAQPITYAELLMIEKERVIASAEKYLREKPITVTEARSERSAGGIHDYYSEGTYWWPNPENPDGPYIRKDGINNPDNFDAHNKALIRFSIHTASLTAAYKITNEKKYAVHAVGHIKAWFVSDETKMNPNFLYAQAIKGVVTGRGIGLIDAIHLIEVARSVEILEEMNAIETDVLLKIKSWFRDFMTWMTTHTYGIDERENGNNHSSWWIAQVAMYSRLIGDSKQIEFCKEYFKTDILEKQMAEDGSFPEELSRTKPYNYSLFNIEAFGTIAVILNEKSFWNYVSPQGKSIKLGFDFIFPFIKDKSKWNFKKDVAHFDELPVRMQSIFFAGYAFDNKEFFDVWKKLNTDYKDEELIRTYPLRQPLLWVNYEK
jgi:hypothetical protein